MLQRYFGIIVISTVLFTGCNVQESQKKPYAGEEKREIKSMSEEKIQGLLEGKGLEYALSAELNHYPGPIHTLDLKKELKLNEQQEKELNELYSTMLEEVKNSGKQLIELERELDKKFASGEITKDQLVKLTQQIATVEGNLRNGHLKTHLNAKEILSAEQVALYDKLRGYTGKDNNTEELNHQH